MIAAPTAENHEGIDVGQAGRLCLQALVKSGVQPRVAPRCAPNPEFANVLAKAADRVLEIGIVGPGVVDQNLPDGIASAARLTW